MLGFCSLGLAGGPGPTSGQRPAHLFWLGLQPRIHPTAAGFAICRSPLKEESEPALRMLRESQHQLVMITGAFRTAFGTEFRLNRWSFGAQKEVWLRCGGNWQRPGVVGSWRVALRARGMHGFRALQPCPSAVAPAPAGDAPLTACHTAAQVHIVTRPVLILTR